MSTRKQQTPRSLSLKNIPPSKWWGSFRRSVSQNNKGKRKSNIWRVGQTPVSTPPSGNSGDESNPIRASGSPRDVTDFPGTTTSNADNLSSIFTTSQPIIILVVVDPVTTKFELLQIKIEADIDDDLTDNVDGAEVEEGQKNRGSLIWKPKKNKQKKKAKKKLSKREKKELQRKRYEKRQMVTINDLLRLNIISKYSNDAFLKKFEYESICDFTTGTTIPYATKLYDIIATSNLVMNFGAVTTDATTSVGGGIGGAAGDALGRSSASKNGKKMGNGDEKEPEKEDFSLPLFTTITPQSLRMAQEQYAKEQKKQNDPNDHNGKENNDNNDLDQYSYDDICSSMDSSSVYTSDNHGNIILVAVPTNSTPEECAFLARKIMTHQLIVNSLERRGIDTSNLLTLDSYSDDGNSASMGHDDIYPSTDEDSNSLQTNGSFSFVSDRSPASSVVRNLFQHPEEGGLWYNSDTDTDGDNGVVRGEDILVDNMAMLSALGDNNSDIMYPSVTSNSIGEHSADDGSSSFSQNQQQQQQQQQPLGYNDYSTVPDGEEGNEEEEEQGRRPSYLPGMISSGFGESLAV